jgi:hypothetical protein
MVKKIISKIPCFVTGDHLWNPFYMEHRVSGKKFVKYTCMRCLKRTKLMNPKEHGDFKKKNGLDVPNSYENVENAPLKR